MKLKILNDVGLYDNDYNYIPGEGIWAGKGIDPAWPGQTPEPHVVISMAPDLPAVPVALTFAFGWQPQHLDLIREMLRQLPGRQLTAIVGHGRSNDSWMALNEGPDGHGSWIISKNLPSVG